MKKELSIMKILAYVKDCSEDDSRRYNDLIRIFEVDHAVECVTESNPLLIFNMVCERIQREGLQHHYRNTSVFFPTSSIVKLVMDYDV